MRERATAAAVTGYFTERRVLNSTRVTTAEPTTGEERNRKHAYPDDLASFVREHWEDSSRGAKDERDDSLPAAPVLEALLSTCYQASLLREEERSVTFRLIFADPDLFPEEEGPPEGLHRLEFTEPRPFDERELRRLSPAVDFERSLIGASPDGGGGIRIWGVVHSGPRWLRSVRGGREPSAPLPPVPVVEVEGPGRLQVGKGSVSVGELEGGRLSDSYTDVFASRWLPELFAPVRAELVELHEEARREAATAGEPWRHHSRRPALPGGEDPRRKARRPQARLHRLRAQETLPYPNSPHHEQASPSPRQGGRGFLSEGRRLGGVRGQRRPRASRARRRDLRVRLPRGRPLRGRRRSTHDPALRAAGLRRRDIRRVTRGHLCAQGPRPGGEEDCRGGHRRGRHPSPLSLSPHRSSARCPRRGDLPGWRRAFREAQGRSGNLLGPGLSQQSRPATTAVTPIR